MEIASRIPTEILREIFLHAIDGPISNIKDNRFPWALNRVCKFWRSVFVTYPDLWTWITIDLAEPPSRGQDTFPVNEWLSICLERSRNYPLNISLHLPTEENDGDSQFITPIWLRLLSCSHRWKVVYLENVPKPQFVMLRSCIAAIPILQSFTIHSPTDIGHSKFTAFQIAPHLTRFTLRTPAAMFAVRRWSIPWMQLTNLILRLEEIDSLKQLCVLFRQLRDIQELRLIIEGEDPEVDLSDFDHDLETPQCLQHLRVLQVCCIEIFGLITAPSLSELYLQGSELFYPSEFFYLPTGNDDPYELVPEGILNRFIQRSSCKIHKLTLSNFSEHLFTPLVEFFPDVVQLCLAEASKCLEHLLSPGHFPGLRVLEVHTVDVKYHCIEILLKVLKLRNSPSTRCSAVPLSKVIFRPVLDDREASVLATTSDWALFESYVQVGTCCELNLAKRDWTSGGCAPRVIKQWPPLSFSNTEITESCNHAIYRKGIRRTRRMSFFMWRDNDSTYPATLDHAVLALGSS